MTKYGFINFVKFVFLFCTVYEFGVSLSSSLGDVSTSRLNIYELENIKFDIEIDNQLKLDSRYVKGKTGGDGSTVVDKMRIKSVNGQTYECDMPSQQDEQYEELDGNVDDQTGDSFLSSLFFETTNLKSKPTHGNANQAHFDFPLIDKELRSYLKQFNDSDLCLYKNLGWWTYEFCFGKYVSQYHVIANGSIMGEKINLGNFSYDYDWLKANATNYPISSGVLYHEQFYETGSLCELNKKPRRSIVKIFCDENESNFIDLVSEIETCVYEIHIMSHLVCSVPNFRKKTNNFNIYCSPVGDEQTYSKYVQKKEKEKIEAELKTKEAVIEEKSQPVKTEEKTPQPVPKPVDKKSQVEIDEDDEDDVNEDDELKFEQIRVNLAESETTINNLKENAKNFRDILNKINAADGDVIDLESSEDFSKLKDLLESSVDQILNGNAIFDTISEKIDQLVETDKKENKKDNPSGTESKNEDDKWKMKVTMINEDQLPASEDQKQPSPDLTDLEKKIAEKLSKSDKLGQKYKDSQIKVKIITIDPANGADSDTLSSLSTEESNTLSSLLASLFQSNEQMEKINSLTSNYNVVYDEDGTELSNEDRPNENNQNANAFLVKNQNPFMTIPDDAEQDDDLDDQNKLLIF